MDFENRVEKMLYEEYLIESANLQKGLVLFIYLESVKYTF